MQISTLRSEIIKGLRDFAWDQWAQMGVLASGWRRDRWAADPEALLLFTLEVGRDDARLFDEVLDWLVVNERQVSVTRLRNLCRDDVDRGLLEASLGWVARRRPRPRLPQQRAVGCLASADPQALFREAQTTVCHPDEAFLVHGWLKSQTEPSHKSQPPDLMAPINFAFRLRHILGVGARAEVLRVLLTINAPSVTAQVVTESAGYTKRNVHEALTWLRMGAVIDSVTVSNEQRYRAPRGRWATILGLAADDLPRHRGMAALAARAPAALALASRSAPC